VTAALGGTTISISGSKVVRNQGHGLTLLKGAEAVVSATTLSGNGGTAVDACACSSRMHVRIHLRVCVQYACVCACMRACVCAC